MSNFMYASATALNAIIRTDLLADEMKIFATDLRAPRGIAFAPDNTLYLVEDRAAQLSVVDGNGKTRKHAGGFAAPMGLVFDGAGNGYVAESVGDSIKVVDAKGTVRTLATGLGNPRYIAFDGKQNLYCTGGPNRDMFRVSLDGEKSRFVEITAAATGIACDAAGNVYVSGERITERGRPSIPYIAKFTPSGQGQVHVRGMENGNITVYGSTNNDYLIYSVAANTIGTFRTQEWSFVRRSAWVEYAATPRDFSFPPS